MGLGTFFKNLFGTTKDNSETAGLNAETRVEKTTEYSTPPEPEQGSYFSAEVTDTSAPIEQISTYSNDGSIELQNTEPLNKSRIEEDAD